MKQKSWKEIRFAFMQSVPVMLGYLFLGFAFGLMLQNAGYNFLWALLSSLVIYAGSMQFVLVTLLAGGASLIYSAVMTLFINGRHIFYGLSFVEKFRNMGKAYPYMIFSLTDETYSVLCGLRVPDGMNDKKISFLISFFDQMYWVAGSVLGALIGQLISFNAEGIDFSMTALFVVIVLNQWMESREHRPAIIGFAVGFAALILLGAEKFLLPALTLTVLVLLGMRQTLAKQEASDRREVTDKQEQTDEQEKSDRREVTDKRQQTDEQEMSDRREVTDKRQQTDEQDASDRRHLTDKRQPADKQKHIDERKQEGGIHSGFNAEDSAS